MLDLFALSSSEPRNYLQRTKKKYNEKNVHLIELMKFVLTKNRKHNNPLYG